LLPAGEIFNKTNHRKGAILQMDNKFSGNLINTSRGANTHPLYGLLVHGQIAVQLS
jgi:hypothetical protein